jgi:hypothetical protein
MGTSASFRAPAVPRWQAFTTALQQGLPLERVQSELFNAGREWEQALSAPAVAVFAAAIIEAHGSLPELLRTSERPEQAIQRALGAARIARESEAGSSANALAERAFVAVLTRATAGSPRWPAPTPRRQPTSSSLLAARVASCCRATSENC